MGAWAMALETKAAKRKDLMIDAVAKKKTTERLKKWLNRNLETP